MKRENSLKRKNQITQIEYPLPLVEAKLVKRYKRFLADVQLNDGSIVTAHCPNPGRMTSCCFEGGLIRILPTSNNQLKYKWVQSLTPFGWAGVDTTLPNQLVYKAFQEQAIPFFQTSYEIKKEFQIEDSRFDFLLTPKCQLEISTVIEVKSVTWYDGNFLRFPDAPSQRAVKHLTTISRLTKEMKHQGAMIYLVQHPEGSCVKPADDIDPNYAKAVKEAKKRNVLFYALRAKFDHWSVSLHLDELDV